MATIETNNFTWHLYDAEGTHQASANEIEFLAAGIGFYGDGASIRIDSGHIVWLEGEDGIAYDSYDQVAETAYSRLDALKAHA